jgi:hypothetical protein
MYVDVYIWYVGELCTFYLVLYYLTCTKSISSGSIVFHLGPIHLILLDHGVSDIFRLISSYCTRHYHISHTPAGKTVLIIFQ